MSDHFRRLARRCFVGSPWSIFAWRVVSLIASALAAVAFWLVYLAALIALAA